MQTEPRGLARHIETSILTSQLLTYLECNQRAYHNIFVVPGVANIVTDRDGRKGSGKHWSFHRSRVFEQSTVERRPRLLLDTGSKQLSSVAGTEETRGTSVMFVYEHIIVKPCRTDK